MGKNTIFSNVVGNTVVCKPSEMTSVTAWMLCQVFHEVGLPEGVLNLVCGYGHKAGEALVNHPGNFDCATINQSWSEWRGGMGHKIFVSWTNTGSSKLKPSPKEGSNLDPNLEI